MIDRTLLTGHAIDRMYGGQSLATVVVAVVVAAVVVAVVVVAAAVVAGFAVMAGRVANVVIRSTFGKSR